MMEFYRLDMEDSYRIKKAGAIITNPTQARGDATSAQKKLIIMMLNRQLFPKPISLNGMIIFI